MKSMRQCLKLFALVGMLFVGFAHAADMQGLQSQKHAASEAKMKAAGKYDYATDIWIVNNSHETVWIAGEGYLYPREALEIYSYDYVRVPVHIETVDHIVIFDDVLSGHQRVTIDDPWAANGFKQAMGSDAEKPTLRVKVE